MGNKHSYTGRAASVGTGIAMGTVVSLLISVIGAGILAWLVVTQRVGEDGIGWGTMIILPIASAAGALTSKLLVKHRVAMVCGLQCAVFYLTLAVSALPFGGGYEGLGITALLIVLGGAITLIPGLMRGKSGARKYQRKAFR